MAGLLSPIALLVLAACGTDHAPDPRRRAPPEPTVVEVAPSLPVEAASGRGAVHGIASFAGRAPAPASIRRDRDPFCARTSAVEQGLLVGAGGAVANVAVYLTKAPAAASVPSAPIVVRQHECTYLPRVQTAVVGQRLEVHTEDTTLHNVHAWRAERTVFNQAQIAGAAPIVRILGEPGLVVLRCDVHPWMRAWVLVLPHPWAKVTGEDGGFTLADVPAGTYTLEAWHEQLGVRSLPVTVETDRVAEVVVRWPAAE